MTTPDEALAGDRAGELGVEPEALGLRDGDEDRERVALRRSPFPEVDACLDLVGEAAVVCIEGRTNVAIFLGGANCKDYNRESKSADNRQKGCPGRCICLHHRDSRVCPVPLMQPTLFDFS